MNLTDNFTLKELSTTRHEDLLDELRELATTHPYQAKLHEVCTHLLEPLRALHGGALIVNSGLRTPALNDRINGSPSSQHLLGEAADVTTGTAEGNKNLWEAARRLAWRGELRFGQMILETPPGASWIHISLGRPYRTAEGAVMTYDGRRYRTVETIRLTKP